MGRREGSDRASSSGGAAVRSAMLAWVAMARPAARIRFVALGIPAFVFPLLYAPGARALTGHGETITVLCRTPSS